VVKESLNKQLLLQKFCQKLVKGLKRLSIRIAEEEDRSRVDLPRLLDRTAFRCLLGTVSHYVLGILAPEWEAARAPIWQQGEVLEEELEAARSLNEPGCPLACELPLRYGLPCRHC
jgi:hypothetical protein